MTPAKLPEIPDIPVPLDEWVRAIALEAARTALTEHAKQCPIAARIDRLDKRFWGLLMVMVGELIGMLALFLRA